MNIVVIGIKIDSISVKRDYKVMLDSMLSLKNDVMTYSTESYKQYFLDQLARGLDEDGRSQEAIEIWKSLPIENTHNYNTLAHWAYAYKHINKLGITHKAGRSSSSWKHR